MHHRILRTIDANMNRVSEGLRVLEDISRFIVEDAPSSIKLKSIRHNLSKAAADINQVLIKSRDVAGDIGARTDLTTTHENLVSVVRANSKRVQEGLRVLEELAKLPQIKSFLSADSLKESRYVVYSVEKNLVEKLSQMDKSELPSQEKKHEREKKAGK